MRTNIEIDEDLVRELMALSGAKTKRQVVDNALRADLKWRKTVKDVRSLRGNFEWEGDLDAMRRDK